MKILLTIHERLTHNAGAAGCTLKLGEEYQKLGHQVSYFSFDDLPSYLPDLVKEVLFPEYVASHIAKLKKNIGLDLVDGSTGDLWFWAKNNQKAIFPALLTRSHGLEHLWHQYHLEQAEVSNRPLSWKYFLYRGSIQLWEVKNSLKYVDYIYLLNQQEKKYAVEYLNIDSEKVGVVSNGIPDAFLNLPFAPTPLDPDSPIKIAQVGTYIPRKGIEYGNVALSNILARYPQAEIGFFGTKCRECSTSDRIYADFDPQYHSRIKVVPRYEHHTLPQLLQEYQIKLFPTLREGFSLGLMEAMACGLAPVTTAHPAALETVADGEQGIIVPLRNAKAMEKALARLIEDRDCLDKLRHDAYQKAQKYSWSKIAKENLALYEEIINTRQTSSLVFGN